MSSLELSYKNIHTVKPKPVKETDDDVSAKKQKKQEEKSWSHRFLERLPLILYSFVPIALVLVFLVAGVNKLYSFDETVKDLSTRVIFNQLPYIYSKLAIIITILIEIVGSGIVMLGLSTLGFILPIFKSFITMDTIIGSLISLIGFTILASLLYHPPTDPSQRMAFLKNMSIVAGLVATIVSIHDFIYHNNIFAWLFGGVKYGDCTVSNIATGMNYVGDCRVFNK